MMLLLFRKHFVCSMYCKCIEFSTADPVSFLLRKSLIFLNWSITPTKISFTWATPNKFLGTMLVYSWVTCLLVFPALESSKTVLKIGCASLRPKADSFWPFQDTFPAQENWGKQVTNTGKNFEHGSNLDNHSNRMFFLNFSSHVNKNLLIEVWRKIFFPHMWGKKLVLYTLFLIKGCEEKNLCV